MEHMTPFSVWSCHYYIEFCYIDVTVESPWTPLPRTPPPETPDWACHSYVELGYVNVSIRALGLPPLDAS